MRPPAALILPTISAGEEDEDTADTANRAQHQRRGGHNMVRPPSGVLRPPANPPAPKQPPRPVPKGPVPTPPSWGNMPMAPPQTTKPIKQSTAHSAQQPGQTRGGPQPKARPPPLKMPSSTDKRKAPAANSSFEVWDNKGTSWAELDQDQFSFDLSSAVVVLQ